MEPGTDSIGESKRMVYIPVLQDAVRRLPVLGAQDKHEWVHANVGGVPRVPGANLAKKSGVIHLKCEQWTLIITLQTQQTTVLLLLKAILGTLTK